MIVDIVTLEKILLSTEASSVIVPGKGGRFEMLDHHSPIISILDNGTIKVTDNKNQIKLINVIGGSIEMSNNKITILADTQ